MLSTSTTQDILNKFELYLDDGTELSDTEELELADKIYKQVCSDRAWEFLRKPATGVITSSGGSAYITLPTDFNFMAENNQDTDNTVEPTNNMSPKVVFVGANFDPWQLINFADRRQYRNRKNYCYIDLANNKLVFCAVPSDISYYEFDYFSVPPDLDLVSSNPLFPARFWDIIYHGMAVDDQIIQLFDRAKSYAKENQMKYADILADMAYWNSQFISI